MPEELVLLAPDPDWSEGFEEKQQWWTDVLAGYTSAEQRVQLRAAPRLALRYRLLLRDAGEVSRLEARLWPLGARRVQVPLWPDATALLDDAEPPDTTLSLDTMTRRFAAGGLGVLWRDAETTEVVEIEAVDFNGLSLVDPVTGTWPADGRTKVVPLLLGRLENVVEFTRPTSAAAQLELEILTDPVAPPAGAWAISYLDSDLWPSEPDAGEDRKVNYERSLHLLDPGMGTTAAWDRAGLPLIQRPNLRLILEGRAAIAEALLFFGRRRGRLVPFWLPAWTRDLQMSANLSAEDPDLVIEAVGYETQFYPDAARRHLALILSGGTPYYREVIAAAPGAPGTEVLTLASGIPVNLDQDRTLVAFLTLVRLADDELGITWHTLKVAEINFGTVELPKEVPTGIGS